MNVYGCIPIKLYLQQKQLGSSQGLPTLNLEAYLVICGSKQYPNPAQRGSTIFLKKPTTIEFYKAVLHMD